MLSVDKGCIFSVSNAYSLRGVGFEKGPASERSAMENDITEEFFNQYLAICPV